MPTYTFSPQSAVAHGRPTGSRKFIVLAGSTAMANGSPRVRRDRPLRDSLVRAGVLLQDGPHHYRFAQDHEFSSASEAAGIIKDGNASGPQLWIDRSTGRSLRDDRKR